MTSSNLAPCGGVTWGEERRDPSTPRCFASSQRSAQDDRVGWVRTKRLVAHLCFSEHLATGLPLPASLQGGNPGPMPLGIAFPIKVRGSHSCAQNAQEWGTLCGVSLQRKSGLLGELPAVALLWEKNAGVPSASRGASGLHTAANSRSFASLRMTILFTMTKFGAA